MVAIALLLACGGGCDDEVGAVSQDLAIPADLAIGHDLSRQINCASVGCGPPPICGEACGSECGCCACSAADPSCDPMRGCILGDGGQ
jgi:hypothetical protein